MFDLKLEQLKTLALYIHIPFCATKCVYCDFNTYAGIEHLIDSYLNALKLEIKLWGTKLNRPKLSTIFFGGGTPSYLNLGQITGLIESMSQTFHVESNIEITVEANPEDISNENTDDKFLKIVKNITSKGFVRSNYEEKLVDLSDVRINLKSKN